MPPVFWVWRNSWEPVMRACSIVATSEILKGSNSSGLMLREVPRSYRYKRPTYPRKMRCVSWRPSGKLFSVVGSSVDRRRAHLLPDNGVRPQVAPIPHHLQASPERRSIGNSGDMSPPPLSL
jgi:hypothetical protein